MAARGKRSKKRSAASSGPRPDPITVFVDECLARYAVPEALKTAGATVVVHHELFQPGTEDSVWLAALAEHPDWLVLTKDRQIQRRPLEQQAYLNARLRVFALTSANLTGEEQAAAFVRALPKIRRLAQRRGPFIAKVTAGGVVQVVMSRPTPRAKPSR